MVVIFLCDMNSFFASVHQSYQSDLRGKPVIVAGNPKKRKGIVVAASYEAKARGVFTTMRFFEAKKKCPNAVFIQPDHGLYRRYSEVIMRFLSRLADCEVASIDEAYLDVSPLIRKGYKGSELAAYIQHKLDNELRIPCSIGAGPNKLIAKMCADVKKPKGFVEMGVKQFQTYFWPQSVSLLHGCGNRTVEKLQMMGLNTIGDVARHPREELWKRFGKKGEELYTKANGIHSSRVNPERKKGSKTLGKSRTFPYDVNDEAMIQKSAKEFSEILADRLKQKQRFARSVTIEAKRDYRKTLTRSLQLDQATQKAEDIEQAALYLYQEHFMNVPLRLFGVRVHNLTEQTYEQLRFPF